MPELPEVETIARGLSKVLKGKRIKQVRTIFPKIVKQDCGLFERELARKMIKAVRRRGKYLLIDLSGGKTILIHLGMTGSFLFASRNPKGSKGSRLDKHDHVILTFRDCDELLRYNDQRKFGKLKVYDTKNETYVSELKKLGPEALEISSSEFVQLFRGRKGMIKPALLNQHIVSGLGNIYADESLHEARIHPAQKINLISKRKLRNLHQAVRKILLKAIRAGGSSIDNYVKVDGELGNFQLQHKAYGREGEPCRKCRTRIKKIKIRQRSSCFCPRCQPMRNA
ncbi:MAG: bifunctional DNA-formamidopyrimidine glycosylase/DNA-(apurinic or apyrimidinic site) lyase [Candidatus Zixiibacteriota bacterium]